MAPLLSTATAFTPLLLLACPVGMGLMMFFMMRGGRQKREGPTPSSPEATSVADLKAEHARLAEQIEQLERRPQNTDRTPAER